MKSPVHAHPKAPAIWAFVIADCCSFAILFGVFMVERHGSAAAFAGGARSLDVSLGLVNTLILLTSGWLVALAMTAARDHAMARCRQVLVAALAVGLGFGVVKIAEYATKLGAGLTPLSSDFLLYYYVLTGLHFLHYLAGVVVLLVMIARSSRSRPPSAADLGLLESGALYWHLVDLLWLMIFPIIYLQLQP